MCSENLAVTSDVKISASPQETSNFGIRHHEKRSL